MRSLSKIIVTAVIGVALAYGIGTLWPPSAVNPDANHAHADFAVWIYGKQMDFSGPKYMSTPPATEASASSFIAVPRAFAHGDEADGHVVPGREFLHLHDGNGHVIHRHKPGLTFGNFLESVGWKRKTVGSQPAHECLVTDTGLQFCISGGGVCKFFHGTTLASPVDIGSLDDAWSYVFADNDHLLLWCADVSDDWHQAWNSMTSDACLYSKTCPWRGEPPTEGCIADPTVPCKE